MMLMNPEHQNYHDGEKSKLTTNKKRVKKKDGNKTCVIAYSHALIINKPMSCIQIL